MVDRNEEGLSRRERQIMDIVFELGEVTGGKVPESFSEKIADLEQRLVIEALQRSGGNQRGAAENLQLTYDQFRHLYRKHNIKERFSG